MDKNKEPISFLRKLFKFDSNNNDKKNRKKINELSQKLMELENRIPYSDIERHPNLILLNDTIIKLQSILNSIFVDFAKNMFYCQNNLMMIYKSLIINHYIELMTTRVLPEIHKPICCFQPEELFVVNENCLYFSNKYVYLIITFFRNMFKYYYTKISLCIEDKELSIQEKSNFIIKVLIDCYKTIGVQIQGIDISCENIYEVDNIHSYFNSCQVAKGHHNPCTAYNRNYLILFISDLVHEFNVITNDILKALNLLKSNSTLIILNFNFLVNHKKLKIDEHPNIKKIINKVKNTFAGTFIMDYNNIDFGEYNEYFNNHKLENSDEFKVLIHYWGKYKKIPDINYIKNEANNIIKEREIIKKEINKLLNNNKV